MTPTLNTKRLVLRPLKKATLRQVDWLHDPKVLQYSEQRHAVHSLATQRHYITHQPAGSYVWAIHLVDDDYHIGNLTAVADRPNGVADLAILIGERACWGLGYATEAFDTTTGWLLGPAGGNFRKVEAGCMSANAAMKKVLNKAGYALEGERRNHYLLGDGQLAGMLLYGRVR